MLVPQIGADEKIFVSHHSMIFVQKVVKKSNLYCIICRREPCIMQYAICTKFLGNMGGFHPKAMCYENYALKQNAL